jgi:DNA-nicking Smr family endonuclease
VNNATTLVVEVILDVEQMDVQEAAILHGAGTAGTVPLILEVTVERYVARVPTSELTHATMAI